MTEKKPTKAGVTELTETDLDKAQGGFTSPGDVAGIKQGKKAAKPGPKGFGSTSGEGPSTF